MIHIDPLTGADIGLTRFPDLRPFRYEDGDQGWWLREAVSVRTNRGTRIDILPGFDFDGASIPRWAWSLAGHPLMLDVLIPAIIHDMGYCAHWATRSNTDGLLIEAMELWQAPSAKRAAFAAAVRIGGAGRWEKTAEEIARYRKLVLIDGRMVA